MTAPPANLPRKHLHTIPHGSALPDGATVEDGYPFLLEVGGTRQLWQNNNGTFQLVGYVPMGGTAGQVLTKTDGTDGNVGWADASGGGGSTPVSPNATQWAFSVTNDGQAYPVPVQGTGTWVLVDNFDQGVGHPASPPWTRSVGSMSASGTYDLDGSDLGQWAVYSPDGSDTLAHSTLTSGVSMVRAHATVVKLPETGKTLELFIRSDGTGHSYYAARVDHAGVLTLVLRLADVETVKETHASAVAVGDVIHVSGNSSDMTVYLTHAGVTTASTTYTDTDIGTSPTDVGIRISGGALARYGCKDISGPGSDTFL